MRNDRDVIFSDAEDVLQSVDLSALDGAKIFITGATGLLGTSFLASLCLFKESGYHVYVTGQYHSTPAEFTSTIVNRAGFRLDTAPPVSADVIIHAATYAQPLRFVNNAAETIRLNTEVTQNLLQSLQSGGKFLFLSSSEVYSGNTKQVVTEDDIGTTTPYHPRACYIEGKRCGEAICHAYRNAGVRAVSARLGATYGPGTRKHDKRVLNTLIEQALTTGKIEREYPGHDSRAYCYVSDAVKMLWQVLLNGSSPVYNVGGVELASVTTMAYAIGAITKAVVMQSKQGYELPGSAKNPSLSMKRFGDEFGSLNQIKFSEGLRRTIEWQKGLYQ